MSRPTNLTNHTRKATNLADQPRIASDQRLTDLTNQRAPLDRPRESPHRVSGLQGSKLRRSISSSTFENRLVRLVRLVRTNKTKGSQATNLRPTSLEVGHA